MIVVDVVMSTLTVKPVALAIVTSAVDLTAVPDPVTTWQTMRGTAANGAPKVTDAEAADAAVITTFTTPDSDSPSRAGVSRIPDAQ